MKYLGDYNHGNTVSAPDPRVILGSASKTLFLAAAPSISLMDRPLNKHTHTDTHTHTHTHTHLLWSISILRLECKVSRKFKPKQNIMKSGPDANGNTIWAVCFCVCGFFWLFFVFSVCLHVWSCVCVCLCVCVCSSVCVYIYLYACVGGPWGGMMLTNSFYSWLIGVTI